MHKDVHHSIVYKSEKLEATRVHQKENGCVQCALANGRMRIAAGKNEALRLGRQDMGE